VPLSEGDYKFTTEKLEGIVIDDITLPSIGTADDKYLDGWHYIFKITVNNPAETNLFVKFSDWVNTENSEEIVGTLGNTRLLLNAGAGVGLTEADIEAGLSLGNNYSDQTPGPVDISGVDTNPDRAGRQVQFDVFVKLPGTTAPGFYTTTFGIQSLVPTGGGGGGGGSTPDVTPPEIISSYPVDNSVDVPVDVQPTLTFSETLDSTTVKSPNIELRDYDTNTKVSATLSLSAGNTVVTFIPSLPLEHNKHYFFFVGTGIKDIAGNSFAAGTWYYAQRSSHEFTTTP